ncbi:MAG: NAD(P)H-dependent oxidoreductase subunit E, partial [Deltaproteobacteria bacterium]|nr:NAD(P)H-dependent oxidoreductase subunit E [Deltaproteobacteria bacterium]
ESSLIAILQEVQSHYNYLPEQVLNLLSKKLEIPLSKIFSLATFYRSFSLKPRGKNLLKVCLGTACHVKSGTNLLEKVKRDLSLSEEETTTGDLVFTVEKVRCLGCCSLAPVVSVNEDTHGSMTQEKLSKVLKKYL